MFRSVRSADADVGFLQSEHALNALLLIVTTVEDFIARWFHTSGTSTFAPTLPLALGSASSLLGGAISKLRRWSPDSRA
jgi:hypothetical protein